MTEVPERELRDLTAPLGPKAEEASVSTNDMIFAEGRVETLIQQMTEKFGKLPDDVTRTVRTASADQLDVWTTRILKARKLKHFLR